MQEKRRKKKKKEEDKSSNPSISNKFSPNVHPDQCAKRLSRLGVGSLRVFTCAFICTNKEKLLADSPGIKKTKQNHNT